MDSMSVTDETFQEFRGWLKAEAPANMKDMSVTPETFHEFRGRLKAEAPLNMAFPCRSPPRRSMEFRGRSNEEASKNMESMSVTDETFQESRVWLKSEAVVNMNCIRVALDVFQGDMS